MGTNELVEKILSDGKAQVAAIAAERDRAVSEIRGRAAAEVTAIEHEYAERTRRDTAAMIEQSRGRARLQQRNAALAARWQVLERAVGQAQEKVLADNGYADLVAAIVRKYARPDSTVALSDTDSRTFGDRLGVKLADPVPIKGGAIIRTGREEMNFSLSEALSGLRDSLARDLSRALFGD